MVNDNNEDKRNNKKKVIYKQNYIGPDNDGSTLNRNQDQDINYKFAYKKLLLDNEEDDVIITYTAAEPIKVGDKLQLVSSDEPFKVMKLRHLKQDAFLFEYSTEAQIFKDSLFCIGVAVSDADNIDQDVSVKLRSY